MLPPKVRNTPASRNARHTATQLRQVINDTLVSKSKSPITTSRAQARGTRQSPPLDHARAVPSPLRPPSAHFRTESQLNSLQGRLPCPPHPARARLVLARVRPCVPRQRHRPPTLRPTFPRTLRPSPRRSAFAHVRPTRPRRIHLRSRSPRSLSSTYAPLAFPSVPSPASPFVRIAVRVAHVTLSNPLAHAPPLARRHLCRPCPCVTVPTTSPRSCFPSPAFRHPCSRLPASPRPRRPVRVPALAYVPDSPGPSCVLPSVPPHSIRVICVSSSPTSPSPASPSAPLPFVRVPPIPSPVVLSDHSHRPCRVSPTPLSVLSSTYLPVVFSYNVPIVDET
ncbi:hypothetical protein DFH09DRAFT_1309827 [Mycena vulgaris]|nr:hypothetical protein DFH09DRAFT_1309827 [Mycena vulgaris]